MEVPRCQTLYVNNINEKVKKEELRRSLYYLFSQFGAILDVVALKTQKMRGQAFVVFRDISSATNALRALQAFPFYDKPLRLAYARGKSDAVRRLDGTMGEKDKKARDKRRAEESGKSRASKRPKSSDKVAASSTSAPPRPAEKDMPADNEDTAAVGDEAPNKILFATNLPPETNEMMLSMLFQQFPGFKEVRLVPGRSDLAFIEFESEGQAGTARTALQGFKITPTNAMSVAFAKK